MKSESGRVENKGNDPLSSRVVGLTIYSLKVSTDPEAASNWTCLMKVWITKKTVTLGSRSQVGFKAIGRNLCESGSLFWRAGGGRQGTGPGVLVGGGGRNSVSQYPTTLSPGQKELFRSALTLVFCYLSVCQSLNSQLPPSPTNFRNFSSGTELYANPLESTVQHCQSVGSTCQDGRVV